MTNRITQTEIAQALGISQRAVSIAFGGGGRISDQTRQAVLRYARKHGYRPNRLATSLRSGQSGSVGVIWSLFDPWTGDSEIAMILLEKLQQQGLATYQIQRSDGHDLRVLCDRFDEILDRYVDAIIFQGIPSELMHPDILARIQQLPTIAICREDIPDFPGDLLIHDRGPAIIQIVDHFVESGRRRLAMVLDIDQESNPSKFEVFHSRCREHGLAPHEHELIPFPPAPKHSRHGLYHAEGLRNHFGDGVIGVDAILTMNDVGAMYVMRELKARGLNIPDDIAVVGFNNTEPAMAWEPPIASADRCYSLAADHLGQMLQARLSQPALPPRRRVQPMKFIWRPSAGGECRKPKSSCTNK